MKIESSYYYGHDGNIMPFFVDCYKNDFISIEQAAVFIREKIIRKDARIKSVIAFTDNGRILNIDEKMYCCVISRFFDL